MEIKLNKTNQVAAASTTVAIEQILVGIDVEGRTAFYVQRAQSDIFLLATNSLGHPMVPLQIIDQRQSAFQAFQFALHYASHFQWHEHMQSLNPAPAEDGGWAKHSSSTAEREPEDVQKRHQVSPGQDQRTSMQDLATSQTPANHFKYLLQKGERGSMVDCYRFTPGWSHRLSF